MKSSPLLLGLCALCAFLAWMAGASPGAPAAAAVVPGPPESRDVARAAPHLEPAPEPPARLELAAPARLPAGSLGGAEAELESLREELARALRSLEALQQRTLETRAALDALAVATCGHVGGAAPGTREALERKPETDWLAWEEVAHHWLHDREAARREVLFLAPAGLLGRFGPPTRIGEEDGVVTWTYGRRAPGGRWDLHARLTLSGGCVSGLSMHVQ